MQGFSVLKLILGLFLSIKMKMVTNTYLFILIFGIGKDFTL